jgi:hypothetical protein
MNSVIRFLKKKSIKEIAQRRKACIDFLQAKGFELKIINGGGTGSIESTFDESYINEITVGSGFFSSHLFDNYKNFKHESALMYAIECTRKPTDNIITCTGGGYVASGAVGLNKQAIPHLPQGLTLLKDEGTGEVQTPFDISECVENLQLGDPIFMRHSKAGEVCERFNKIHILVDEKNIVPIVPKNLYGDFLKKVYNRIDTDIKNNTYANGINFDGIDDRITLPNNSFGTGSNPTSILAFLKNDTFAARQIVLSQGNNNSNTDAFTIESPSSVVNDAVSIAFTNSTIAARSLSWKSLMAGNTNLGFRGKDGGAVSSFSLSNTLNKTGTSCAIGAFGNPAGVAPFDGLISAVIRINDIPTTQLNSNVYNLYKSTLGNGLGLP